MLSAEIDVACLCLSPLSNVQTTSHNQHTKIPDPVACRTQITVRDTNEAYWRYHEAVVGDRPELCALDFHLFQDLENALYQNIIRTACLPVGDPRRYDDGTPAQLKSALVRTWATHPLPDRIVQDIFRYPVVIDRIVECQGGVVPDHTMQHGGCSRHKRKETKVASTRESLVYQPSSEISAITKAHMDELHTKARAMLDL